VFELERRIYRIESLRLNPTGVPVRGIAYFLALLATTLLAARLPLLGSAVRMMPWCLRDLAMPGAMAVVLTIIRLEGRPFHLAALALVRYGVGPRELAGLRPYLASDRHWRLDELLLLADGSDSRLRQLRYTGPGAVHVSVAHIRAEWDRGLLRALTRRAGITVGPMPGRRAPVRGQVIALTAGARLDVESGQKRHRRTFGPGRGIRRDRDGGSSEVNRGARRWS
jgi:hypothetical protein